jgi:hypothetical protein
MAGRIGRLGGDGLSIQKNLNIIMWLNLDGDSGGARDPLGTLVGVEDGAESGDDVTPSKEEAQGKRAHAGEGAKSYGGKIIVHV